MYIQPIVEVAFATQPMSTSPTWTDITDYVILDSAVQIQRGRGDEFSRVQPGTISLSLNNTDGRFTRGSTSSPYQPNVKVGKRIRFSYVYTSKNLVTNTSFETNTTGWSPGGTVLPTLTQSATHVHHGSQAMLITWGTGGTSPRAETTINGLISGRTYTASGWAWVSAGDPAVKFAISGGSTGSQTTTTGAFQQFSLTFVASASSHILQILAHTSPTSGDTVWIDEVQVELGSNITAFSSTAAALYRRFDGHVNEWPIQWQAPTWAPVTVTATDRFKRFGSLGELRSTLEEETLRDTVVSGVSSAVYYPLGEPEGSLSVMSITKNTQAAGTLMPIGSAQFPSGREAAIEFGTGTGPGTDEISAPIFAPKAVDNGKLISVEFTDEIGGTSGLTFECWFRVSGLGIVQDSTIIDRTVAVLSGSVDSLDNHVAFQIDSTGKLHGRRYRDGALLYQIVSSTVKNDGETHHVVLTESLSGTTVTAKMYIDSTLLASQPTYTVATGATITTFTRMAIGGNFWIPGDLFTGTISHVAAHGTAISSTRVTDHYKAGKNGIAGERTDVRIARIADWISFPASERVLDVGDSTVGWQSTGGTQPVAAMQDVEETENGVLFISTEGKLIFHKRSRRFNVTASFTLDAENADQLHISLAIPGDDFGLINDARATRPRNSEVRAVNQASIDEFGLYRFTTTVLNDSDIFAQAAVDWLATAYGQELTRIPNVTINMFALGDRNPTLAASILNSEISHMMELTDLPTSAPATTLNVFIEGWTETFSSGDWTIMFNCSPAVVGSVWQLAVSGSSELGTTTKLAY